MSMTWFQEHYGWGSAMWPLTYKLGMVDNDAFTVVEREIAQTARERGEEIGLGGTAQTLGMLAAAKWVDGACRMLTTAKGYWAAMACTKLHAGAAEDLRVPWPSFSIEIPPGVLLHRDGSNYRYLHLTEFDRLVTEEHDGPFTLTMLDGEPGANIPTISVMAPYGMAETLFTPTMNEKQMSAVVEDSGVDGDFDLTHEMGVDVTQRIVEAAHRAAVGLLYTLQHTNNWRKSVFSPIGSRQLREGPPPHRAIVVGKPMAIDCAPALRAAISGESKGAPSVQTLVRGHIKRQVVGAGRTGRKIIWIEPYWRGPDGAPILVRPLKVGR